MWNTNKKVKVGDRVKIIKSFRDSSKLYWNPSMESTIGLKGTLLSIDGFKFEVGFQHHNWTYYEDCLEIVENEAVEDYALSLKNRIKALTSLGEEAFKIMREIGGNYTISFPTVTEKYRNIIVYERNRDGVDIDKNYTLKVLFVAPCYKDCDIAEAYKSALLFMAEKEGKLRYKEGTILETELNGQKYKVKVL